MRLASILTAFILGFSPAAASAAEEGGLIAFSPGVMFWTVVTFIIVAVVLRMFAWGPILEQAALREKRIRDAIADAEKAQKESKRLQEEFEERLEKARAEAEAIIKEGRDDALKVKDKYEQEQRAEGEALKQRAINEIDLAKGKALEEIRLEAKTLAIEIASKVLAREVSGEDHERLVEEALEGYDRAVRDMEAEGR
ncbi:MAG: F0F1 ATP synthase subunit B [Planctomycetota bacterium]|nr:F0F1 ATP synthase subunit B [Planctomycetota bacterium]